MSIHCNLGYETSDHQLMSVYCHCDGEPSRVGLYLVGYYAAPEKARALIRLGDLGSVGKRLAPDEGEYHTMQHPVFGEKLTGGPVELFGMEPGTTRESVTIAYHRDRGDPLNYCWSDTTDLSDVEVKRAMGRTISADYYYIFRNGQWFFFDDRENRFVPLTLEFIVAWAEWLQHKLEQMYGE